MNKNMTLYEAFNESATAHLNKPSILYLNKEINFKKVKNNVDLLAACLNNYGIKSGEVVIVGLPNTPEAQYCIYAINKIGAVCYLVHALSSKEQIREAVIKTGAKLIFALDSVSCDYTGVTEELDFLKLVYCKPTLSLSGLKRTLYDLKYKKNNSVLKSGKNYIDYKDFLKIYANKQKSIALPDYDYPEIDSKAMAILLNSGGTAGLPKTVEISAYAINALCSDGLNILRTDSVENKYMLSPLPFFHGFGLAMGLHAMASNGGCNVLLPKFKRKAAVDYVRKNKVNFMIGVPAVYSALLSHKKFKGKCLKSIDTAFVGGDFIPQTLLDNFNNRLNESGSKGMLFEGYGLTETISVCCVNLKGKFKKHSVGTPVKDAAIKAVKNENTLEITNKTVDSKYVCGELCVSGDTLMNGYYKDEEATKNAFFKDENGVLYLKTGDYGYVDEDNFVFLKQRIKRIIKVSGVSIYPSEIEQIVSGIEGITNVCAHEIPDKKKGNDIRICVETLSENHNQIRAKIIQKITEYLPSDCMPKEVVFHEKLPLTKMNKVDFETLKKM